MNKKKRLANKKHRKNKDRVKKLKLASLKLKKTIKPVAQKNRSQ